MTPCWWSCPTIMSLLWLAKLGSIFKSLSALHDALVTLMHNMMSLLWLAQLGTISKNRFALQEALVIRMPNNHVAFMFGSIVDYIQDLFCRTRCLGDTHAQYDVLHYALEILMPNMSLLLWLSQLGTISKNLSALHDALVMLMPNFFTNIIMTLWIDAIEKLCIGQLYFHNTFLHLTIFLEAINEAIPNSDDKCKF